MPKSPANVDPKRSPRLIALETIRDRLSLEMADAHGTALASVAKQLRDTLREIEGLVPPEEVSAVDEIAARRSARRAADLPDATAVGDNRRRGSRRPSV